MKQRDELPETNYVAMKIRIKFGDHSKINFLIQNLRNSNFEIKMFSSVENPQEVFYLLLDLPHSELEQQADDTKYYMNHSENHLKVKYLKIFKEKYEPFRSKDKQQIIMNLLTRAVNISDLEKRGILMKLFMIHDMNEVFDVT